MAIDDAMTEASMERAKLHIYNVVQQGASFTLLKSSGTDEMGESLGNTELPLHAHPVRFSPFERKVLESISWSDTVDVIFYVSTKEIEDLDMSKSQLKRFTELEYNGKVYEVSQIEENLSFAGVSLYYYIGARG